MRALLQTEGIGMTSRRTRERMINRLIEQGISSHKILDAIRNVPRHLFMDDALASRAYEDTALPIGHGQTISQPYIVAKMTELLVDHQHMKSVLEIGTGCGYQTAVLAQLVDYVYSVERIEPLYRQAKNRLWDLQVRNVSYLHSDGGWGWPEKAPYDGILVAAAPPEIPQALLDQMAVGGIMLIPIGKERGVQELQRVIRTQTGYEIESLEPVSFVPFLSGKK
ncbi:MAG: protein-L-isoaspartate(D-aspartate) O-methyltransferase [Gammaproteobacteria bacterium]|nr:MAG: protein-L-isoaspartate(D-aspartate) O-methyltransferase [Gammaproteobacteria bacterium]